MSSFSSSTRRSSQFLPSVRLSVFALFALLLLANVPQSEANMRLCGSKLTKTITAVCGGHVCGAYIDAPHKIVPFSQNDAYEVHQAVKREAGLATECCTYRCSYSHLKKFCC